MGAAATAERFAGFPARAFMFFADLAANNDREWFQPRKAEFEASCLAPLKALTVALDPPDGAARITRIHRDVRFSKDKSPYQTHLSTMVCGHYLQLSAEGLYVGTGVYMPEPELLRRLRDAIGDDDSGAALQTIVQQLRKKGCVVQSHEAVSSAPRGYAADHPRIELLRMKDIHAGRTLPPASLGSAKAVTAVRGVFTELAPFKAWLERQIGATGCA